MLKYSIVNLEVRKKYAEKVEYFKISSLDEELKKIYRDLTNDQLYYLGMKMICDELIKE